MAELGDALGQAADQHIDQMHGAKTLPGAIGAGQQLLRGDLAVAKLRRRQAVVAIAATGGGRFLAEITEQAAAPAARGFRQRHQRIELADRDALERIRAGGLVDHAALLHDVGQAIGHPGAGGLAVAPGSTGLLIIGLDAFRQIEMRHEAHVRLVDAHAERDGGNDDDAVLVDEAILVAGAQACIEARVIRQRSYTGLGQGISGVLDLGARQAIDDAGVSGVAFADEGFELGRRILLFDDLITNIRAVETRDEAWCAGKPEAGHDLLARHFVGGRGQCNARHVGKAFGDRGQADIFRAEIMPPL